MRHLLPRHAAPAGHCAFVEHEVWAASTAQKPPTQNPPPLQLASVVQAGFVGFVQRPTLPGPR
jgi:hypothetical protein